MRASRFVLYVAAALALAVPAFSQTNFQYQQYPVTTGSAEVAAPNAHSVDFNGDGMADVLTPDVYYKCTGTSSSETCVAHYALYLWLSNGSGGLNSPVTLPVTLTALPAGIAIADFNGDGHLDIAVLDTTGVLTILYGNGNGTFQTPKTMQLPSGTYTSLVEADFDVNGTQDLAALNGDGNLVMLFNNGKGVFTQQTTQIDTPPSGYTDASLVVGDFNADGRPDLAWVQDGDIGSQGSTIYSALNDSKGVFNPKQEVGTLPIGEGHILSADLDLDGASDLIAWATQISEECCSQYPVTLYYGIGGQGSFTSQVLDTTYVTDVAVTDINGDGYPDILLSSTGGLTVYTGDGNDRNFTNAGQYTSLPGGPGLMGVGFYNSTNRMGFAATNDGSTGFNGDNYLYLVSNDNTQGNCPYPTSAGVTFCQVQQEGSTWLFRGTARAKTQPVERIELWANGKKIYQVFSDEFNDTVDIPAGTQVTAVEVDANGVTHTATATAGSSTGSCSAPSSPGVHVCSPTAGETTTSPVTFTAAGTGASGSVNHLELWIDGKKIGNYGGSVMNTNVTVASGSHTATVIEVDSKGADVKSTPVTFTVSTGTTGSCSAPSSPGVHVCSPTAGESTYSPVNFIASGTGASGSVNHLELWIDGGKIGNYNGSTMNGAVALQPGSHTATVIEVDSKGNDVKSAPVTFTVTSSSACSAPSSPGVHVCSPTAGETTTSPINFVATGKGASGSVNHMELWINGTKFGNYAGANMSASIGLNPSSYAATIVEVDSKGNYIKSTPVSFTVK